MKKKRFHYAISGYRWAPESYRVSKRLAENFCSVIPLTPDVALRTSCENLSHNLQKRKSV